MEYTHTHLCSTLERERERVVAGEGGESVFLGFTFYLFGASIMRKLLLGFPRINLCCSCDTFSFSDPIYMILL